MRRWNRSKRLRTEHAIADPHALLPLRQLGAQALSRASGAPLVDGNQVHVLEDAAGNFPVWLAAIRSAQSRVYLENYIFEEDEVGVAFADALSERARAGARVRVIRDWMGTRRRASKAFWQRLASSGVEIRCFNPPRLDSPFGWVSRDHRKLIAVDGQVAFVAGLCISQRWSGDPAHGIPPWRDTGLEIRGPAVADIERAFAQLWDVMGEPIPPAELSDERGIPRVGEVALRVIPGAPSIAGLFRMDQLLAAVARRSLWLTDAYFVGVTPYVQALLAAARDDVDVRLLVPNATDLPLVRSISRAGYRPLLEAGVRIFEWNGSMLHAKTAVVDGRWSRVGSSNLNLASFLGNYELDVAIEDEAISSCMEQMYLRDLTNATEILLERNRVVGAPSKRALTVRARLARAASTVRAQGSGVAGSGTALGAIRAANAVGAALTNHRIIGPAEGRLLLSNGLILVAIAVLATIWPRLVAIPVAILALWIGVSLLCRTRRLAHSATKEKARKAPPAQARP